MREARGITFIALMLGLAVYAAPADLPVVGASAPSTISSVVVSPISERSTIFTDRGRTYIVGLNSGKVTVIDGSAPSPSPFIPPYTPPGPSLTGLSRQVYETVMGLPLDAQNRVLGANALILAIDSTVSEVGGLNVTDLQQIINKLAVNAEANQVSTLLQGFKLGSILEGAGITNRDQMLKTFEDIKKGLEKIK
jgi:hypothetical protein